VLGRTTVEVRNSVARFTDLFTFAAPRKGLQLHFTAFLASQGIRANTSLMVTSNVFTIYNRTSAFAFAVYPDKATSGQPLLYQPSITLMSAYMEMVSLEVVGIEAMLLYSRKDDKDVVLCTCNSICPDKCTVNADPSPSTSDQATNTDVPLLVGNTYSVSMKGTATFTDLAVVIPESGATLTWVNFRLRFAAMVGPVSDKSIVFIDSSIMTILQWSHRLVMRSPLDLKNEIGYYSAGETLPELEFELQDSEGKRIRNSNVDLVVGFHPDMNVANPGDYLFMDSCASAGSTCKVLIQDGVARFTDLKVTWVSQSASLFFATAILPGAPLSFNVTTDNFVVNPAKFSRLKFETRPQRQFAGQVLSNVLISAVDDFGNIDTQATGYKVILGLNQCNNATDCTLGEQSTVKGQVKFVDLVVFVSGVHVLKARIVTESCLVDPNLRNTDLSRREWICQQRRDQVSSSEEFEILPETPASVTIVEDIEPFWHVAGEPFPAQPLIAVKDIYGNYVKDVFNIVVRVADGNGRGCVCDYSRALNAMLCLDAHPNVSIQTCKGTCPRPTLSLQDRAVVPTVNGTARFTGLTCTRMSCSRNCTFPACEETNCAPVNQFRMTFSLEAALPPSAYSRPFQQEMCSKCIQTSRPFDIYPAAYTTIVPEPFEIVIGGSPEDGAFAAGFYSSIPYRPYRPRREKPVNFAGNKYMHELTRMPPAFRVTDAYGNVNGSVSGYARISLPLGVQPDFAGYAFCVARMTSEQGTICLTGSLNAAFRGGFCAFTDIFIRHEGPGWKMQFTFGTVTALSDIFHVLPSPPILSGIAFSDNFASVVFNFNTPTNRAGMQERLTCEDVLSPAAILSLGPNPMCSWESDYKLVATVRSNATVRISDDLKLAPNAVIYTSAHYSRMMQSDGSYRNSRVVVPQPEGLSLTSPRSTPICRPVMLPERLKPHAELDALPASHQSNSPNAEYVSSAAAAYFEIDGENFVAIANFCRGKNCKHDAEVRLASAEYDIFSSVYKWKDDGSFTFVQAIPTQGAMDVKAFEEEDSREDGPPGRKQFLVFANFYSRVKDPRLCASVFDCTANATVWQYNYLKKQFERRQNIRSVSYGTAVDVRRHNGELYLAATSTVIAEYVQVFRWIEGGFRYDETEGWIYGWQPGQTFGWVPAGFSNLVQELPAASASDAHLYHAGSHFCLAVANYANGTSNKAPVNVYKFNPTGCSLVGGCFELVAQLPALGAKSVANADSHPASGGNVRHFLVVANSFEGDRDAEVPSHSIKNSYVYVIDYETGAFELVQAIQTASAQAVRVFQHCGFPMCRTFLTISNMKGLSGMAEMSKVYKLSERRPETLMNSTCALSTKEQFEEVLGVPTVGGVELSLIENKRDQLPYFFAVLSNGGVGVKVFKLDQVVPNPQAVVDHSRYFGACDPLVLDARASVNSGGRSFQVEWKFVSFVPFNPKQNTCRNINDACAPPVMKEIVRSKALLNEFSMPMIPDETGMGVVYDPHYFPAGKYELRLNLFNWMQGQGTSDPIRLVKTTEQSPPLIKIEGSHKVKVQAAEENIFLGVATPSQCLGAGEPILEFEWSIEPPAYGFGEAWGSRRRTLVIPAHSLSINRTYTVTVKAIQGISFSTAAVEVHALMTRPVAKLSGGDRLVSLANPASLLLDASSSFSHDNILGLQYAWSCGKYVKVLDQDLGVSKFECELVTETPPTSDVSSITIVGQKLLAQTMDFAPSTLLPTFTEGCLIKSQVYRCDPTAIFIFTVTVCLPGVECKKDTDMSSSVSVEWSTTPRDPGLSVTISPRDSYRISPVYDVIVLGSSNEESSRVSYRWVQMKSDYNLLEPSVVRTSLVSNVLVLQAGVMQGAQTFTFRLYASSEQSLQDMSRLELQTCAVCSWAEVTLFSNLAPSSGQFNVEPTVGIALQTKFKLSAQEWVDPNIPQEDYPLSYTFGYKDSGGAVKYLIVDSLYSSYDSILPVGNMMCPTNSRAGCRALELILEVADSLQARGVADGLLVYSSIPAGDRFSILFDSSMQTANQLYKAQDGKQILSIVASSADFLNDLSLPFALNGLTGFWKSRTREQLVQLLQISASNLMQPMTLPDAAHVFSTLYGLCMYAEEITLESASSASDIIIMVGTEVLRRQRLGQGVDRMKEILNFMVLTVAEVSGSLSNSNRRRAAITKEHFPEHADLWGGHEFYRPQDTKSRRATGPTEVSTSGMQAVKSVQLISQLAVSTHQVLQQPVLAEQQTFKSITRRIEARAISEKYQISINASVVYNLGSSPQVNPKEPLPLTASIELPSLESLGVPAFEVQTAVLYTNPLPESQTYFSCINPHSFTMWASPEVLVPKDNFGGLEKKVLKSGIAKHATRLCTLIGQAHLFEVRVFGTDTNVQEFGNGKRAKIRLPFNVQIQPNVLPTDLFADEFSGVGSSLACVYWNSEVHAWSQAGVEFIEAYYGDANGFGAYVDCWTTQLGVFLVSEVALDCNLKTLGGKVKDWCGVCGGDNSTCSGCDGIPYSGRSKKCSGHGSCQGIEPMINDRCNCAENYMGVICQIYCNPAVNCSGHGRCYAEYKGLSMNTSVGCHCEPGYKQTWENGYLECVGVPYYTYKMPWGLFYFLVVGVPCLFIICCMVCVCFGLTSRQVAITKKMQRDIEGFVSDYEHENEDFTIDKAEINADLCMPMIGHIDEDDGEEQQPLKIERKGIHDALPVSDTEGQRTREHLQIEQTKGIHDELPFRDTEGQRTRRHQHLRSDAPSSSDAETGAPTRLLQIMPAGEQIADDTVDDEDWRKYLVKTALNKRLRAVQGYMNAGPRSPEGGHRHRDDDDGGDEVAV